MPQYITIKNFGPITSIEKMEVKDFMLFIGERATGKSTIAKLIHFFQTIDYVIVFILLRNAEQKSSPTKVSVEQGIFNRIKGYYPSYTISKESYVRYYFDQDVFIDLVGDIDSFNILFSEKLNEFIDGLRKYAENIYQNNDGKSDNRIKRNLTLWEMSESLSRYLGVFGQTVYIPSQRSVVSLFEGQTILEKVNIDEILDQYITILNISKKKNHDIIAASKTKENIYYSYLPQILNGQIVLDSSESLNIQLNTNQTIAIQNASSGQQETIWLLMILAGLILDDNGSMVFVEEPEAGLDPKTQSLMMEAMVAFANHKVDNKFNQVIITTHSPFILGRLNNILYASKLSKEHMDEVLEIGFKPEILLDPERVAAYKCVGGGVMPILSDGMLDNEEVDNISDKTLSDLDLLIDLDLKYEKRED